jgi:hypothetical protein
LNDLMQETRPDSMSLTHKSDDVNTFCPKDMIFNSWSSRPAIIICLRESAVKGKEY